jgi:SAM-dependent MidA family methyltransferase
MTNARQLDSLPVPDAAALAHAQALRERIDAALAAAGGWLPFNRYMELALYEPGLGYYSSAATKFGRRPEDGSDFITAPELSPLFALSLANAVGDALAASATHEIMEFGAGTGKLAAGLLDALARQGGPCRRYTIVELSADLRARQQQTLAERVPHLLPQVHWLEALPAAFAGVVLGNEVLDAMPVRLVARAGGVWHERGVARDAAALMFQDRALAPVDAAADAALAEIAEATENEPDYLTETHEAARAFVATVCAMLTRGTALFIDYGFARSEYYHPQRNTGTLMCHYRHRSHGDPLFYPGLQDITSHVEFSGIAQAGLDAGADLLGYTSQARFLVNCGITRALEALDPGRPEVFLPAANAVQKLLSEAEMGELFKVIGFGRGLDGTLPAFEHGDRSASL